MNGTGITAEQVIAISGVVTTLTQIVKASGVKGPMALLVCAVLSALAVALFGYSNVGFGQAVAWSYFASWASVCMASVGIFGVIDAGPGAALQIGKGVAQMKHLVTRTGTGDGTTQE